MTAASGSRPVGVVDCGTNSVRLLVAGPDGSTLDRRMIITRLGDGVDQHRRLSDAAMDRTLSVLRTYRSAMDEHGVGRRRAVATSAARDASNHEEFFDRAEEVLGVRPELLSGLEEGRLSYAGATADLAGGAGTVALTGSAGSAGLTEPAGGSAERVAPVLVVDIGGGSTELVLGSPLTGPAPEGAGEIQAVSLDLGCVRVSERFLRRDPPDADQLRKAAEHVGAELARARRSLEGVERAGLMVGLAGTVSTAAMMDIGARTYRRDEVHHHRLARARVGQLLATLSKLDRAARSAQPGLEPGRVDVIVGGLMVLVGVMDGFGFDECLVSESDILDGLAAELLGGR